MRSRALLLLLWLGGCASTTTLVPQAQPNIPVAVPIAQPMTFNSVQWQALSADQLRQLAAQLQKSQDDHVVFVLDATNYNNLSLNMAEIERYIKEQNAILDMLKTLIAQRVNLQDK